MNEFEVIRKKRTKQLHKNRITKTAHSFKGWLHICLRKMEERGVQATCSSASAYLGILVHRLLHVFQEVIVWATLLLINVDYPIQIREISVQIYPLGITSTNKPVFKFTGLNEGKKQKEKGAWQIEELRNQFLCRYIYQCKFTSCSYLSRSQE